MRELIWACAILLALVAPARGDGIGVIAGSARDRGAVASAVADAIGPGRRVVPDAVGEARLQLAGGAVPVETLARFRRVRDLIDEGWRAYLRVAVDVAALRLANARTEAEALLPYPGGAELYADAALRLGAVLGHLGRGADAEAVLRLAVTLDPDRPITLAEFSPDVVDAVAAVRAGKPAMQRLEITTTPARATVSVDGREVGRSPIVVEVTRGQHVIVARAALYEPAVRGVAVDAGAQVALTLSPDEAAARLAGGPALGLSERAQQELVDAAVVYADLDEVVVAAETSRRGGPTLLVQRCAGRPARCSAVVDIGYGDPTGLPAAARSAWDAAKAGELRYPPSVLGERVRGGGDDRCKLCRSPWLWGGVGAAIVLGTVITIAATSGSRPPPTVGVDPGDFVP
ncbi:MAG TPA: PEGA domain-containing protein [Kofleriaceae bacterium]|nr:PEGA domain-containing protein [Kofleriaceae bacterium]